MKRKYLILFSLSGLILTCDQLTKHLIQGALQPDERFVCIPGFLMLTNIRSNSFVFGTLHNVPGSLQNLVFIGIPVFALILIILIFIKIQDDQILSSIALTTILAGAVGNLIDRANYGYVVDFVHVHLGNLLHFPTFNIADVSIIVGVSIMFFNTLFQARVRA